MLEPQQGEMPRVRRRLFASARANLAWEWSANLVMVGLYLSFAYRFVTAYRETPRLSSLLYLVVVSILAVLFLVRRQARSVSADPFAWAVALAGTWVPLLLRPTRGEEILIGQGLLVVGIVLQVLGVLSLARSFGIVPANRGIQTGGLYRVVRHPLYSAYFLSYGGFLINHWSPYNAVALVLWAAFQLRRVHYEEELLSQDPEYREFMQRTRWRILPLVY